MNGSVLACFHHQVGQHAVGIAFAIDEVEKRFEAALPATLLRNVSRKAWRNNLLASSANCCSVGRSSRYCRNSISPCGSSFT